MYSFFFPLSQVKLGVLASKIGYVGMFVAVTTFLALMIVKGAGGEAAKTRDWGSWTIGAFIYAVTIIVVAIPEVRRIRGPFDIRLAFIGLGLCDFVAGPATCRHRLARLLDA